MLGGFNYLFQKESEKNITSQAKAKFPRTGCNHGGSQLKKEFITKING